MAAKILTLSTAVLALAALTATTPAGAEGPAVAVTGVALPEGYRNWTAAAPSHRLDKGHIRMMLVNDVMAKAYREGTLPFPEGSSIAKLIYKAEASKEWKDAIVPGEALTVEIMVKDSKRFPGSAGWGFGRFSADGKPVGDAEVYKTCFPCHEANVVGHDFVFTRWAP